MGFLSTSLLSVSRWGVLSTMYYLKLSFVVTFVYLYLLISSSSNDSNLYVPKAKRGQLGDAMINAVSKLAYSTGSKLMQVAEWATKSPNGKEMRKYARIQRLRNSMIGSIRTNYHVIFGNVHGC
jgi:hypothetical protein